MPPTLRSAQSSPVGKTTFATPSPDVTPGRKAPTCTKCGQPKLGHPRSGCPFTDSPTKDTEASPTRPKPKSLQENLSDAFGSMYLESAQAPSEKTETKERRNRRSIGKPQLQTSETLASISTSAEDILNDLTKPVFFSQATVTDDDEMGLAGRNAHTPSKVRIKSGPQILMPGTLMAPSWESSIGGFFDAVKSNEDQKKVPVVPKSSLGVQTSFSDSAQSPLPLSPSASQTSALPRPLQRSQTQEQRELFLSSLSHTSPASVYTHKKRDIDEVWASAMSAKLHVRVINNAAKDGEEDVMVVIGSDPRAVEKLADEIAKSIKETAPTASEITNNLSTTKARDGRSSTSSSTLKAVAGGAIVGAVGTWAGLAFS
ncbi:hypothetical protein P691DRAFT_700244 [Macrolepiota fuliginosa MF-IS2]|uniref:Uncharacterized protein n=1 Tax=Macrolepiota fuliginosa MF-IS2 TaxID=1400762 RepID=A0A9P6C3P9_9AGAR|nr:hypothetical protein P691DRAFT_700244 [Macrolepiota fuliginosa MF-IS2]